MNRLFRGTMLAIVSLLLSHVAQAAGLSENDALIAHRLADNTPWPVTSRERSDHVLGIQTVSVELAESKSAASGQIGRVYQFNHSTRQSRVVTVDLINARVMSQSSIDSVHLPLSRAEIQFAFNALSSSDVLDSMRNEQITRGVAPFTTLEELDVKASIYAPKDAAHTCHSQRCALLSLFDSTSTVFAIEPIVLLGSGDVITLTQR